MKFKEFMGFPKDLVFRHCSEPGLFRVRMVAFRSINALADHMFCKQKVPE